MIITFNQCNHKEFRLAIAGARQIFQNKVFFFSLPGVFSEEKSFYSHLRTKIDFL
jgi:hypothetical protein